MMGLYDYTVPPGFGDTYFNYVFDASNLTDGQSYFNQSLALIDDGDFILRRIAGINTVINSATGTVQFYDPNLRNFFSAPAQLGSYASGKAVLPEKYYPVRSAIRGDLGTISRAVAGTDGGLIVYRSQLIFSGVRRRKDFISDPVSSTYKYYEKEYSIPFSLSIANYASVSGILSPPATQLIPIQDYDFELRRIELALQSNQQPSQFAVTLYDNNQVATSSAPILSNYLCHLDPTTSSGELSFLPSPPLLYRVNSNIRMDVWSLLFSPTALPQTFRMNFVGVRRIPCN